MATTTTSNAEQVIKQVEEKLSSLTLTLQKKEAEHEQAEKERAAQKKEEEQELRQLTQQVRKTQEGCVCDGDFVSLYQDAWYMFLKDAELLRTAEEREELQTVSDRLFGVFLGVAPIRSDEAQKLYGELLTQYKVPALTLSTRSPERTSFSFANNYGQRPLSDHVIYFDVITGSHCSTFFISSTTDLYLGYINSKTGIMYADTYLKKRTLRERLLMTLSPSTTDQQLLLGTSLLLAQVIEA